MNVLLAALIGLGLALGAALLLEYMDDTVKTTDMARRRLGLPALGTVAQLEGVAEAGRRPGDRHRPRARRRPRPSAPCAPTCSSPCWSSRRPRCWSPAPTPARARPAWWPTWASCWPRAASAWCWWTPTCGAPALHRVFGLPNSLGLTSLLLDDGLTPADALQPVASTRRAVRAHQWPAAAQPVRGAGVQRHGPPPGTPGRRGRSHHSGQPAGAGSHRPRRPGPPGRRHAAGRWTPAPPTPTWSARPSTCWPRWA